MNARQEADPRVQQLRDLNDELAEMLDWPVLFAADEVLGKSLAIARLAFDIAGCGHDETQRRALFQALADYVDVPALPVLLLDDPVCGDCELPMSVCACEDVVRQDAAA